MKNGGYPFRTQVKRPSTMLFMLHIEVGNNISIVLLASQGLLPVCICLWVIVR